MVQIIALDKISHHIVFIVDKNHYTQILFRSFRFSVIQFITIIMASNKVLPLELIDKAIGQKVWILMRGQTELVGVLRGFDDFVNLVLDDAVEFIPDPRNPGKMCKTDLQSEILLNGNHITVIIPGGSGPENS